MDILDIRAIAHHFGDDSSSSTRRALLLLTIIKQYLAELKSNRNNVISHDGYIVRTSVELQYLTGISDKVIYGDLDFLCDEGLIEKRKGLGMKLRIDPEELFFRMTDWKAEYNEWLTAKLAGCRENRSQFYSDVTERLQKIGNERKDIIENMDTGDFQSLTELMDDIDAVFIYLFSHYYRAYTGQTYTWNLVKFNTMIGNWRTGIYKPFPEYALSKALKDSLDDKSDRFLELKWRERFNPDSHQLADGIAFDSLMEAS